MACTSGTSPVYLVHLVYLVYLVCLVHRVGLVQPNKQDKPNKPIKQDRLADFFSIRLGLCCEVGEEPIADRYGHLEKILPPSKLVIGAWQELQPLRTSQRVTQSSALMEGDTFILLTLDN